MQFCVIDQNTKVLLRQMVRIVGKCEHKKSNASSKITKTAFILAVIGLTVISITKNNTKVTPRKRYKVSIRFFRVITVRLR